MSDRPEPSPESLFASWLEAREGGVGPEWEAFCAELAAHADALRALHAEHERQQAPPTVDIGPGGGGAEAWDAFLEQLRARGSN